MAKLSAQEIIDSLKEMTLLEIKEVVDLMKEEFGVDPSAVAVAAAPAADTAAAGPSEQDVILASCGANKIAVIKLIKDMLFASYFFNSLINSSNKEIICNPEFIYLWPKLLIA